MKLSSLSKSARAIGLMFLLSVMVGTSMQQSTQAQNRTQPQAPVRCVQPKGFFVEFQDIKFTPKQEAAFRRISAEMSKKAAEQLKNVRTEPIPNAFVDFGAKDKPISAEIVKKIDDSIAAMERTRVPRGEQVRLLTEKFGQYAVFRQASRLRFTPAQIAEKEKMNRDFEAQMMSIFTPQQQRVYRANLVTKRQIEACDIDKSDG